MNRIDCTLITGAAQTADLYTDWVDTRGMTEISFHVTSTGTGSAVGEWKVEVSNDPRCRHELDFEPKVTGANSTAKKVDITAGVTVVHGNAGSLSQSGAFDVFFSLSGLPRYIRLFYDRTSGGTGSACSVFSSGRS